MAGKALIEKGAAPRIAPLEPIPGAPPTQDLPLFIGGPVIVAAEIHDLPAASETSKPVPGYKMYTSPSGYTWVPKEEADVLFAPADEASDTIITKALTQGLRIVIPAPTTPPPPVATPKSKMGSAP